MGLTKYKLGELIEQSTKKNGNNKYGKDNVIGLSTQKVMIPTKADLSHAKMTGYKLFEPHTFAYVPDTSRRADKVSMAYNTTNEVFLVSSISVVFKVSKPDLLLSDYLYIYFNRPEFDRYARFNSWGTNREPFSWNDMCDIDIELPDITIQQKYVDIYNALLENQKAYEQGADDLKLVCDAYIENLRKKIESEEIGPYIDGIVKHDVEHKINKYCGLNQNNKLVLSDKPPRDLANENVVYHNCLVYSPETSVSNNYNMNVAINRSDTCIVSHLYHVLQVHSYNDKELLPEYLILWLTRPEFSRYAKFHAFGSAREFFHVPDMKQVKIPIPNIEMQQSIADIYNVYIERQETAERLKQLIQDICPILIKGAVEEGQTE